MSKNILPESIDFYNTALKRVFIYNTLCKCLYLCLIKVKNRRFKQRSYYMCLCKINISLSFFNKFSQSLLSFKSHHFIIL